MWDLGFVKIAKEAMLNWEPYQWWWSRWEGTLRCCKVWGSGGRCAGEGAETPTRGCLSFHQATGPVLGCFCSSPQQGWDAREHRGPWENPAPSLAADTGAGAQHRAGLVPISPANLSIVISLIAPLLKQKKEVKLIRVFIQGSFASPAAAVPDLGLWAQHRSERQRKWLFAVVESLPPWWEQTKGFWYRNFRWWRLWRSTGLKWGVDFSSV